MAMADAEKISGGITLIWRDQLAFLAVSIPKFMTIVFVAVICLFFVLWFNDLPNGQRQQFHAEPLQGVWLFAKELGGVIASFLLAALLTILGLSWVGFRRLPAANRVLSYEADAHALATRDSADVALTIPWSMVKEVRSTKRLMLMKLHSGSWRYVPWRAFTEESRGPLLHLAKSGKS
jgi:hypothetical protein